MERQTTQSQRPKWQDVEAEAFRANRHMKQLKANVQKTVQQSSLRALLPADFWLMTNMRGAL